MIVTSHAQAGLKNCPFCRPLLDIPERWPIYQERHYTGGMSDDHGLQGRIWCQNCYASSAWMYVGPRSEERDAVIASWNQRTEDFQPLEEK